MSTQIFTTYRLKLAFCCVVVRLITNKRSYFSNTQKRKQEADEEVIDKAILKFNEMNTLMLKLPNSYHKIIQMIRQKSLNILLCCGNTPLCYICSNRHNHR